MNDVDKQLDALMTDENRAKSNWFKFEKVGDSISGVLLGSRHEEGKNGFPAQLVFEVRTKDGDEWNVPLRAVKADGGPSTYAQQTKRWQPGDLVGFKYEKELPAQQKGYKPAKIIQLFHKAGDPANVPAPVEAGGEEF